MIQISSKQGHPPGGAELSSSQDYCFSCRATAAPRPLFTQTGHEDSHANVMLEQHPELLRTGTEQQETVGRQNVDLVTETECAHLQ